MISTSALLAIFSHADPSGTSYGDSTAIKFRCYQQGGSRAPRIHSAIRRGATGSRRRRDLLDNLDFQRALQAYLLATSAFDDT